MKIIIEIEDVKETPRSPNKVIASIFHAGKVDKNSLAFVIAWNAMDLIDKQRRNINPQQEG